MGREPTRRGRRLPRPPAAAGHRPGHRPQGARPRRGAPQHGGARRVPPAGCGRRRLAEFELAWRWYEPHLQRLHEDAEIRAGDLAQLAQIAAGYRSRESFLTELTLDPPDATSGEAGAPLLDEDYLILSTIHSAKGQEWHAVYILNVVDGCIPSDMATGSPAEIEEERRLLYVAMTRAKDDLQLLMPQRFYTHQQPRYGDRHVYAARSRFIPAAILHHFECSSGVSSTAAAPRLAAAGAPIDVGARLREMWR